MFTNEQLTTAFESLTSDKLEQLERDYPKYSSNERVLIGLKDEDICIDNDRLSKSNYEMLKSFVKTKGYRVHYVNLKSANQAKKGVAKPSKKSEAHQTVDIFEKFIAIRDALTEVDEMDQKKVRAAAELTDTTEIFEALGKL